MAAEERKIGDVMIKPFTLGQEEEIYKLVCAVFKDFVGFEYTKEGSKEFNDFIEPEKMVQRYINGNIILTYQLGGSIVGMIEVRDNNHICLFFVDKDHHHKGIGRKLLNEVLVKVKGKTNFIEVNASPFSEKIYAKLGFKKTSDKLEKNGIIFIPMKMEL